MRQADGSLIAEVPTPRTGGPGLPATLGALRSDLQAVLCERVYAAGVTVRLGLTVRALAQDSQQAYAEFSDGGQGRYDLVVGADGIKSAVRSMIGITTAPQPTGMSIWRVVADRPAEMDCAEVYYGGPRYKAGYSPISPGKCYAYILDSDGTAGDFGDAPAWQLMYERSAGYGGTWGKVRETIGRDRRRRARVPPADRPGGRHVRRGRRGARRARHRRPAARAGTARVHGAADAARRGRRAQLDAPGALGDGP
jgi:2-polyprenyl-6-methoxyphenol hydroxylase-like FAD-dependent oxidoreductase